MSDYVWGVKNLKQALADYLLKPETLANRALPVKFLETVQARTQPPAGDSYYGSKASGYNAGRDRQPWWVEENRLVEALVETLPPLSNVLDVPCGTGRFFDFFASKGIAVTGLDSSSDMLAEAAILSSQLRENFVPDLHEGSAVALPFADSSFELVVCVRFLRSIISFGEAKKVMREIGRVSSRWALLELDIRPSGKKARFSIRPPVNAGWLVFGRNQTTPGAVQFASSLVTQDWGEEDQPLHYSGGKSNHRAA